MSTSKIDSRWAEDMCRIAAAIRDADRNGPSRVTDLYVTEVQFSYDGEVVARLTANDFEDFDLSVVEPS